MKEGQKEQILAYLQQGNSITPLEALEKFGCFRLGARIFDLKEAGHNIITETETKNKKSYAKYTLVSQPQQALFPA